MRASEAAQIIGCSARHVRYLIKTGALWATKQKLPWGTYWNIRAADVRQYRDKPQTVGYPRGKPRGAKR